MATAACPATADQLATEIRTGFEAFKSMDASGFESAAGDASQSAGCLTETLSVDAVASYHQLMGLKAFLARDTATAGLSFQSAHSANPEAKLPEDIAPAGGVAATLYETATKQEDGEYTPLYGPTGLRVKVDGHERSVRPTFRPSLVQVYDPDVGVKWSGVVAGVDPNPDWSHLAPAVALVPDAPVEKPPEKLPDHFENVKPDRPGGGLNMPLLAGAGAGALASGALLLAASSAKGRFEDTSTSFDDLPGLRQQANTLSAAAIVTGAAAGGLAAGAVLTVDF
jgi:hypothetical protein